MEIGYNILKSELHFQNIFYFYLCIFTLIQNLKEDLLI